MFALGWRVWVPKKNSSMNFMIYLKMDVASEWIGDEVVFRPGMAWNR